MEWLTKKQVKEIVGEALHAVADYDDDCENHDFTNFQAYHKQEFINTIQRLLSERGYWVPLSLTQLDELGNITELIKYIDNEQGFIGPAKPKIKLQ